MRACVRACVRACPVRPLLRIHFLTRPALTQITDLLAADALRAAFRALARGKAAADGVPHRALQFDHNSSWLRARAPTEVTPTHVDWYYWKLQTDMFAVPPALQTQPKGARCGECDDYLRSTDGAEQCCECYHYFHRTCCATAMEAQGGTGTPTRAPSSPLLHSFLRGDELWYCPGCAVRPVLGTCWVPLGDVPVSDGVLAILPGTAALPNFGTNTKAHQNVQVPDSFAAKRGANVKGLPWKTAGFNAGDVVIFSSQLAHCSSKNYGKGLRLSADFRWYLMPERPSDTDDAMAVGHGNGDENEGKDADADADADAAGNAHRRYVLQNSAPF